LGRAALHSEGTVRSRRNRGHTISFELILSGRRYSCEARDAGKDLLVGVGGRVFRIRLESQPLGVIRATVNGKPRKVSIIKESSSTLVLKIEGRLVTLERPPALLPSRESITSHASIEEGYLSSPLPGVIVSIEVREGEEVEIGRPLFTIEAMKMESIIRADKHARVSEVVVKKGEAVRKGQPLLRYE